MLLIRSPLLDSGATGITAEMYNGLAFMQSATDIIFLLTRTTWNGPSYISERSLHILTMSQGRLQFL